LKPLWYSPKPIWINILPGTVKKGMLPITVQTIMHVGTKLCCTILLIIEGITFVATT